MKFVFHSFRWGMRTVVACLLLAAFGTASLFGTVKVPKERAAEFKVTEAKDKLNLVTPYGEKVYTGDMRFDSTRHYKIAIPLSQLRPPGSELEVSAPDGMGGLDSEDEEEEEDDADEDETDEVSETEVDETLIQRGPASIAPTWMGPPAPLQAAAPEIDDTDRLIVEANHYYHLGKFYEALVSVDEVIRKKPEMLRAWIMKGSLLYVQGHKDLAKKAWQKALTLDPESLLIKDLMVRYQ